MDDLHPMSGFPISKDNRIPRNLWDRPPWNRWSFQHIREILPTTEVWRGTGSSWLLPEAENNLDELEFVNPKNQSTTLLEWLTDNYADGIAVHRGTLVYERYFNRMTQRTLHLSQSMAKSVTSAVAGILVGRGLLDPKKKSPLICLNLRRLPGTVPHSDTHSTWRPVYGTSKITKHWTPISQLLTSPRAGEHLSRAYPSSRVFGIRSSVLNRQLDLTASDLNTDRLKQMCLRTAWNASLARVLLS